MTKTADSIKADDLVAARSSVTAEEILVTFYRFRYRCLLRLEGIYPGIPISWLDHALRGYGLLNCRYRRRRMEASPPIYDICSEEAVELTFFGRYNLILLVYELSYT